MEFSLGLVEVSSLGNAIKMLDEMTKVADVEFVAVERKLGGRLVTIVVRGSVSAVNASVAAGKAAAESMNSPRNLQVPASGRKTDCKRTRKNGSRAEKACSEENRCKGST